MRYFFFPYLSDYYPSKKNFFATHQKINIHTGSIIHTRRADIVYWKRHLFVPKKNWIPSFTSKLGIYHVNNIFIWLNITCISMKWFYFDRIWNFAKRFHCVTIMREKDKIQTMMLFNLGNSKSIYNGTGILLRTDFDW